MNSQKSSYLSKILLDSFSQLPYSVTVLFLYSFLDQGRLLKMLT